jgi:hypothetical protein
MPLLKLLGAGVVILSLVSGPLAAQSILGEYHCAGSAPGGETYKGKVFIQKLEAPLYTLKWDLGSGVSYAGTGVFEDDILAAAYGGDKPYGLAIYQVKGGKLKGRWLMGGQTGLGEEQLEGPGGVSGTYTITSARNPDGAPYSGKVTISKNGEAYLVNWALPSESYSGIGILVGNIFVVGWGQGSGFGTVVYVRENGNFTGKWAAAGADRLGIETLTRSGAK